MSTVESKQCVALVTGGAQGIGRAVAVRLLHDGYAVTIADSNDEAGALAEALCAAHGNCTFVRTDVRSEKDVARAVAQTVARYGALSALVSNAAISDPGRTPVENLSLDEWQRVLETNLTGAFLCAKHAAPHLRRAHGAMVLIASTRALQSEPHTTAYSASKGGLVALTHSLAVSLGPDVRVNCISPGWIDVREWRLPAREALPLTTVDHSQHPCGRVGMPEDIAAMAAFLLSDEAGFITGENIVVDGGMTRKMIYV
jgi:NAD(P)-dependent dehydrogenase (short-subunit alcohol dehydrogenase family)